MAAPTHQQHMSKYSITNVGQVRGATAVAAAAHGGRVHVQRPRINDSQTAAARELDINHGDARRTPDRPSSPVYERRKRAVLTVPLRLAPRPGGIPASA